MLMMALLPPGGLLGGYAEDPDGVNGSWEKACTSVSTPIRVRVALATSEFLGCSERLGRSNAQGGFRPNGRSNAFEQGLAG